MLYHGTKVEVQVSTVYTLLPCQVPVMLYHGTKDERKELRDRIHRPHTVREGVKVRAVVITSYEVAMMDQRFLQRHEWRYLAVDEGHRIKNTHCRLIR